jgi:hypothetical protein
MTESPDPTADYERCLVARRATVAELDRRSRGLAVARLVTAAVLVGLLAGALGFGWLTPWWLIAPAAVFAGLVVVHDRVIRSRAGALRAVDWYERGLGRIADRWTGTGATGERFTDPEHLYAQDLDLFGVGSLFELLSTAGTSAGEETLANWLSAPANRDRVLQRQDAVRDLTPRSALRETLATSAADVRIVICHEMLVDWATEPRQLPAWLRPASGALGAATLLVCAAWAGGLVDFTPLLGLLLVNTMIGVVFRRAVDRVLHRASVPVGELGVFGRLLDLVRRESFTAARLRDLQTELDREGDADAVLRRVVWYSELHDWQHNQMFGPIGAAMLWGTQCACAIESWRDRHGAAVSRWLAIVGEFEALSSLATFAYEHPADPYPELVADKDTPIFEADAITHPLLSRAAAVSNDVRLGPVPRALIVSGSNMSGKTTFLRSVGVNAVLAQMGAPVRARRLRLSPVAIGATLRIEDSLQAGRSRFYAEVTRIGRLVDTARTGPVLFLLDELFHGTNSHDRTAGAEGLIGSLIGMRTIGLVTTHDLSLAAIGDRLAPSVANVHFEDRFVEGELRFDYRLKPGPVTRSNALAIMRAVGLDVPDEPRD